MAPPERYRWFSPIQLKLRNLGAVHIKNLDGPHFKLVVHPNTVSVL